MAKVSPATPRDTLYVFGTANVVFLAFSSEEPGKFPEGWEVTVGILARNERSRMMIGVYNHRNETQGIEVPLPLSVSVSQDP